MPIPPANLIDIGTDEDAGFWSDALRFAPFPHTDYPAPGSPDPSIQARHTDRRDARPPVNVPAVNSHSIHDGRFAGAARVSTETIAASQLGTGAGR